MSSTTDSHPASILGPRSSAKCLTPQVLSGFASDTRMPRYFFHVRMKQGTVIPNQIGIEFRDLAAARADAPAPASHQHDLLVSVRSCGVRANSSSPRS